MTNADSHFAIGKTHKVCQDYALAGNIADRAYALVSDGCSSSEDSDFGARLLARAAVRNLRSFGNSFDPERAAWTADGWREAIRLSPSALDATLLMAFELTDRKKVRVVVVGDGVVAARYRDTGKYDYWAIRYPSGAPGYLTYLLDQERQQVFLAQTQGKRTIETVMEGKSSLQEEDWSLRGPAWQRHFETDQYDLIAVMSDGAESFQRFQGTSLEAIPLSEVLDQVMSVKGCTGEFMHRRINRFLTRFCLDNGWQHYDDFSVAALALEPRDNE